MGKLISTNKTTGEDCSSIGFEVGTICDLTSA